MVLKTVAFVVVVAAIVALGALLVVSTRHALRKATPRYLKLSLGFFIMLQSLLWFGLMWRGLLDGAAMGFVGDPAASFARGPAQTVIGWLTLVFLLLLLVFGARLAAAVRRRETLISVISDGSPLDITLSDIDLTPRELDVLLAIQDGKLSNNELAEHLYVSPATVSTHVTKVMKKAGVSDRRELMLIVTGTRAKEVA